MNLFGKKEKKKINKNCGNNYILKNGGKNNTQVKYNKTYEKNFNFKKWLKN